MKDLKIKCVTAEEKNFSGQVTEESRELAEMVIKVEDDFQLTNEIKQELSKKVSELISGIATKEKDVYQCNCSIE
ncbi:hypothetical protein [Flagellimonas sp.]|uniref:hypothetical protein n=1 Tax=Flagellimonas sp. TaxID=2058762 RepID=UPI003BA8A490